MISKMNYNLQQLKNLIEEFSLSNNLLSCNYSDNNSEVFKFLYQFLTGELLGWEPVNPEFILKENAPKKPVFITKNNNRRTQLKSLQHLPLFN
ncbi:GSCOCG00009490001-RA-CDS [Cotesia congregata]|nr:GSCOCG00009490001-RA-CDS [Cotesia congregata]